MKHMVVRFIGKSNPIALLHGKDYSVMSVENGWYRIVDESGEDYLYPPDAFEIIEPIQSGVILAKSETPEDMTLHIDDSVDFIALETRLIERRLEEHPGKSRREVAKMLFCEEIVNELDAAGALD